MKRERDRRPKFADRLAQLLIPARSHGCFPLQATCRAANTKFLPFDPSRLAKSSHGLSSRLRTLFSLSSIFLRLQLDHSVIFHILFPSWPSRYTSPPRQRKKNPVKLGDSLGQLSTRPVVGGPAAQLLKLNVTPNLFIRSMSYNQSKNCNLLSLSAHSSFLLSSYPISRSFSLTLGCFLLHLLNSVARPRERDSEK